MIELINETKKLGWLVEIKEIRENSAMLRTLNDEVKQFESLDVSRYLIKAIVNNKTIILNTEDISDTESIINSIKSNYEILDNDDKDMLASESIIEQDRALNSIDIDLIRKDMLGLSEYKKDYPNILNIDAIFDYCNKEITILNSDDIKLSQNTNFKSMYLSITVKEGEQVSEVSDYYLFNEYSSLELKDFFMSVLNDAINRLEEDSVESSRYDVIINNNAMYSILKTFSEMFNAKNINQGLSILSDKFGNNIFSDKITIVEEPLNNNLKGTYRVLFDSEGSKCSNKVIVENGKFITKLYDNKEAIKDSVRSTGNSDGVNNMYIVPGKSDFNSLVANLNNGIIITDLKGLHSGVNTITGDMSLEAKGYLVESGNITKPLNSILLSANIFELLYNVKEVGSDLKFGSTHVGSPSIRVENIMIVGEK